jgi:hypothetical protein
MAAANPFATRFTRPGRIAPLDAAGRPVDLSALLDRLDAVGGRAAIEGSHGSGKSTLLTRLHDLAAARGGLSVLHRLGAGPWRDAAVAITAVLWASPAGLVFLDSWERLGPFARWATRLAARRRGCRLVVTSHGPAGLPVLTRCQPSVDMLLAIVRELPEAASWLGPVVGDHDIREAFARHAPNIREALFDLYDLFEERRGGRQPSGS